MLDPKPRNPKDFKVDKLPTALKLFDIVDLLVPRGGTKALPRQALQVSERGFHGFMGSTLAEPVTIGLILWKTSPGWASPTPVLGPNAPAPTQPPAHQEHQRAFVSPKVGCRAAAPKLLKACPEGLQAGLRVWGSGFTVRVTWNPFRISK